MESAESIQPIPPMSVLTHTVQYGVLERAFR